jgi:hypothetical protein
VRRKGPTATAENSSGFGAVEVEHGIVVTGIDAPGKALTGIEG